MPPANSEEAVSEASASPSAAMPQPAARPSFQAPTWPTYALPTPSGWPASTPLPPGQHLTWAGLPPSTAAAPPPPGNAGTAPGTKPVRRPRGSFGAGAVAAGRPEVLAPALGLAARSGRTAACLVLGRARPGVGSPRSRISSRSSTAARLCGRGNRRLHIRRRAERADSWTNSGWPRRSQRDSRRRRLDVRRRGPSGSPRRPPGYLSSPASLGILLLGA
jgi:hypothetical protein